MESYLWIAGGGALGSMARYWLSGLVDTMTSGTFPWGTLLVNVFGSLIIGLFATITGPEPHGRIIVEATTRQFVMIGILGGFTTFSSFSLQTLNLVNSGEWLYAGLNICASVFLCLLSVWVGHVIATYISVMKWI